MRVVGYCFVSNKDSALVRNARRTGRSRVPDAAIRAKYSELEYPVLDEGFDELYYVTIEDGCYKVEAYDETRNQ